MSALVLAARAPQPDTGSHARAVGGKYLRQHEGRTRGRANPRDPVFAISAHAPRRGWIDPIVVRSANSTSRNCKHRSGHDGVDTRTTAPGVTGQSLDCGLAVLQGIGGVAAVLLRGAEIRPAKRGEQGHEPRALLPTGVWAACVRCLDTGARVGSQSVRCSSASACPAAGRRLGWHRIECGRLIEPMSSCPCSTM
jgi:hypothetical protein